MAEDKMKKKEENTEAEKDNLKAQAHGDNGTDDKGKKETGDATAKEDEKKKKSKKDTKTDNLAELEEKLEELSDKHLRLQAEFDNFKRRTLREKADLIKSGGETVLMGILPVIDDFERAIVSLEEIPEDDPGKKGTLLIYSKFKEFLKQNNIREIEALHKEFDVDFHEALTKAPAPEEKFKGKVIDVIQKGYLLNDKVIRYAKVVVGE